MSVSVFSGQGAESRRLVRLILLAPVVAVLATLAAHLLEVLIAGVTQLAFYGRWSAEAVSPAGHTRGVWVILIPALGGGAIALLARYGSRAIIGHGIPEVMQQVLANRSRIAPRVAVLKPLSSAISIGMGGPYGAEGPVIATGGAIGSLLGQAITLTAIDRKILLSAGAASAMTAVFGSPIAATLLAVELLLFEFRARSVIPVAIAASAAQALRFAWGEPAALFALALPSGASAPPASWWLFVLVGACAGGLAVLANHAVHLAEDGFARLRIHWMWCPVVGGLAVGVIGWCEPRVLGAGYDVIAALLAGEMPWRVVAIVCGLKLLAWVISLGSGTSGGTLAPMLIIGGGTGALIAAACAWPAWAGVAPGLVALAGMGAFFAGGSRAYFASIVLGVEITQQAGALWPLATAATAALAVAHLLSARSIMTTPVERRGVRVPMDFDADVFAHLSVGTVMEAKPRTIPASLTVARLAERVGAHDPTLGHHSALLIVDEDDGLAGIITRRDLLAAIERGEAGREVGEVASRGLVLAYPDETLHDAVRRMHAHDIGRLPVVDRADPRRLLGYLGRAAVLSACHLRWQENHQPERGWLPTRSKPTD